MEDSSSDSNGDDGARKEQKEAVRIMSKKMRDKRRTALQIDQQEATALEKEMEARDMHTEQLFTALNSKRNLYFKKINFLLQMGFSSKSSSLLQQPTGAPSISNYLPLKLLSELTEFFVHDLKVTMPVMHLHYSKPSKVANNRFEFNGIESLLTFTEGTEVWCSAMAHSVQVQSEGETAGKESLVEKFFIEVRINPASFVVEGNLVSASYRISSVNAVLCGGKSEIDIDGMLMATFRQDEGVDISKHKIATVDMYLDTSELQAKVLQSFTPSTFTAQVMQTVMGQQTVASFPASVPTDLPTDLSTSNADIPIPQGVLSQYQFSATVDYDESTLTPVDSVPAAANLLSSFSAAEIDNILARSKLFLPTCMYHDQLSTEIPPESVSDSVPASVSRLFIEVYPINTPSARGNDTSAAAANTATTLLFVVTHCAAPKSIPMARIVARCLLAVLRDHHGFQWCSGMTLGKCICKPEHSERCQYKHSLSVILESARELLTACEQHLEATGSSVADGAVLVFQFRLWVERVAESRELLCITRHPDGGTQLSLSHPDSLLNFTATSASLDSFQSNSFSMSRSTSAENFTTTSSTYTQVHGSGGQNMLASVTNSSSTATLAATRYEYNQGSSSPSDSSTDDSKEGANGVRTSIGGFGKIPSAHDLFERIDNHRHNSTELSVIHDFVVYYLDSVRRSGLSLPTEL